MFHAQIHDVFRPLQKEKKIRIVKEEEVRIGTMERRRVLFIAKRAHHVNVVKRAKCLLL